MRTTLLLLISFAFIATSCKKNNDNPDDPQSDGSYPGKLKSINGGAWAFRYDGDGKLIEYDYLYFGLYKTVIITWETDQVTVNDGVGFTSVRPFNSAGYVIPNANEASYSWTYDSENQIATMLGSNYYWSNGNLDSLLFGSTRTLFEYTSDLETRDYGSERIPKLPNFPGYIRNIKNLKSNIIQFDGAGDTLSVKLYTYTFDSNNRIASELVNIVVDGDTSYHSLLNYAYYE